MRLPRTVQAPVPPAGKQPVSPAGKPLSTFDEMRAFAKDGASACGSRHGETACLSRGEASFDEMSAFAKDGASARDSPRR